MPPKSDSFADDSRSREGGGASVAPRLSLLADLELPAVLAGGPDPDTRIPSVSIDDVAAMGLVLDHLDARALRHVADELGGAGEV